MNYFGKIGQLIKKKKKNQQKVLEIFETQNLSFTHVQKKDNIYIYLKIIYEEQNEKDVIKIPSIKISNNQVNKRFFLRQKEKKSFLIDDQKVKNSN